MRFVKHLLLLLAAWIIVFSCQRELDFGESIGTLSKDAKNNCDPIIPQGIFKVDTAINSDHYIDVQIVVEYPGTFHIYSDTINGYYFYQSGKVSKGNQSIRLYAQGQPIKKGVDHFIIHYGHSTCNFDNNVKGLEPAIYTLIGQPDSCKDFFADGTYLTNTNLTASNILLIKVNVTGEGTYNITAITKNNFTFTGEGIFSHTGEQTVVLKGTGKPIKEELTSVTVTAPTTSCKCGINVISDQAGKAIFTFDGSPNNCVNMAFNGNYYANVGMDVTNTLVMSVNVTKIGTYSVATNAANGITFSASGAFIKTGPQTITLTASGIPIYSETSAFVPNTGTVSCNFYLNILPTPPPAVFTLSGAPGNCNPATVTGIFKATKPLGGADVVVVQVNVTTPGLYNISTITVNGFSFAGKGVFTAAGVQNVTLYGKGTPQATQLTGFSFSNINPSCGFSVNVL
ncbi:MAG: hypothetical protein HY252_07225 [Sphingobacteriales bacterium]|nr:hypothetical protein [Sphingobacteriales bacterium]